MQAISFSNARENLKKLCDEVISDCETFIITRKRGENVILISEAEYNNMRENDYLLGNPTNRQRLLESLEQMKRGKFQTRELVEIEEDIHE